MPDPAPDRGASVVLGIDYGTRRIGIATGNTLTGTARALETITHDGDPFERLAHLIAQWRPDHVVVGLPLAADGTETDSTRAARRFAAELAERHPGVSVSLHDERFSSRAAQARFVEARRSGQARRRDARKLDGVAAAVIVESWLAARAAPSAGEHA